VSLNDIANVVFRIRFHYVPVLTLVWFLDTTIRSADPTCMLTARFGKADLHACQTVLTALNLGTPKPRDFCTRILSR
jgi:hypothetical protein